MDASKRKETTQEGEARLGGHKRERKVNVEEARTTNFFFTETPEDFGAKEMYAVFKENGDIDEVILPPKKDKRGKHFGFVRYFNVADARVLTIKLDNIIIGSKKIHANLSRFNLDFSQGPARGYEQNGECNNRDLTFNNHLKGVFKSGVNDGKAKTYAQAVDNKKPNKQRVDILEWANKIPFAHLEYNLDPIYMVGF